MLEAVECYQQGRDWTDPTRNKTMPLLFRHGSIRLYTRSSKYIRGKRSWAEEECKDRQVLVGFYCPTGEQTMLRGPDAAFTPKGNYNPYTSKKGVKTLKTRGGQGFTLTASSDTPYQLTLMAGVGAILEIFGEVDGLKLFNPEKHHSVDVIAKLWQSAIWKVNADTTKKMHDYMVSGANKYQWATQAEIFQPMNTPAIVTATNAVNEEPLPANVTATDAANEPSATLSLALLAQEQNNGQEIDQRQFDNLFGAEDENGPPSPQRRRLNSLDDEYTTMDVVDANEQPMEQAAVALVNLDQALVDLDIPDTVNIHDPDYINK